MAKKRLIPAEKVYDANNDIVHYEADGLSGNATLCGQTDFIGQIQPEITEDPVSCDACLSVLEFFQTHSFD